MLAMECDQNYPDKDHNDVDDDNDNDDSFLQPKSLAIITGLTQEGFIIPIIFFSFFFFSFFDWPRTTTNISGSTSSVMKGGQGTSLLSHLVLTTFVKSPIFTPSILTQFFQFHPPLYIFSQILLLFFTPFLKRKTFRSLSPFFLIVAALLTLFTHCQLLYLTLQCLHHTLTRCPSGELLRA